MFDIGFAELSMILVIALLVIGPEKLPSVARTVGRYVGKLQRFVSNARSEFNSQLESGELRKLIGDQEEQIRELKTIVSDAKRGVDSATSSLRDIGEDAMREPAQPAQPAPPSTDKTDKADKSS